MRIQNNLLILFIAGICTLISCGGPKLMTIGSLSEFESGANYSESMFSDFIIEDKFEINDLTGNDVYKVVIFKNLISRRTSSIQFIPFSYDYQHYFAFAFKNNSLLFWGFPDEFCKSDDINLNKLGDRITAKILESID